MWNKLKAWWEDRMQVITFHRHFDVETQTTTTNIHVEPWFMLAMIAGAFALGTQLVHLVLIGILVYLIILLIRSI